MPEGNCIVSVIMTTFNAEKHVRDAVQSILDQSLTDFEFIILDDGSTDSTGEVLREFKDPRIQLEFREHRGRAKALNDAVQLATGEYIANIDADDIAFPERLEKEVAFLNENVDIGVVGTSKVIFCEKTGKSRTQFYPESNTQIRKVIGRFNPFFHSSIMIRKEALTSVGMYNEKRKCLVDYDLWIRLLSRYKGANLQELLAMKRIHSDNFFRNNRSLTVHKIYYGFRLRLKASFLFYGSLKDIATPFYWISKLTVNAIYRLIK